MSTTEDDAVVMVAEEQDSTHDERSTDDNPKQDEYTMEKHHSEQLVFRNLYRSELDQWPVLWQSQEGTDAKWIPIYRCNDTSGSKLIAWGGHGETAIDVTDKFDTAQATSYPMASIFERRKVLEQLIEQEGIEKEKQRQFLDLRKNLQPETFSPVVVTRTTENSETVTPRLPVIHQFQNYLNRVIIPVQECDEYVNEELLFMEHIKICLEGRHFGGAEYCHQMLTDTKHPSCSIFYGVVADPNMQTAHPALFFGPRVFTTSKDHNDNGKLVCYMCSNLQDDDGHHEPMLVKVNVPDFFGVINKPLCSYTMDVRPRLQSQGIVTKSHRLHKTQEEKTTIPILMPVTFTLARDLFNNISIKHSSLGQCSAIIYEHVSKHWSDKASTYVQQILSTHFTKDESLEKGVVGELSCWWEDHHFHIEDKENAKQLLMADLSNVLNASVINFQFQPAHCLTYRLSAIDTATEIYDRWVTSAQQNVEASNVLLAENSYGSSLRGVLVGKAEASIEEFLLTKVILDVRSTGIKKLLEPFLDRYTIGKQKKNTTSTHQDRASVYCKILENNLLHKSFAIHRAKFYYKTETSQVSQAVACAIFGVNKRDPPKEIPRKMTQRFLHFVLRHCIALMHGMHRLKITEDVAKQAYTAACNAKQDLAWMCYQPYAHEFLEEFKKMLETKYLDCDSDSESDSENHSVKKYKPGTPITAKNPQGPKLVYEIAHSCEDPGHPVANWHYFHPNPTSCSEEVWYFTLEHPFSPKFVDDLLREWNQVQWIPAQGGQQGNSYVRCLSTSDKDKPAMVVADRILYPCAAVNSPMEKKLISGLQKVCTAFFDSMRKLHPEIEHPEILGLNLLHVLASNTGYGLYGAHSDFNMMVALKPNESKVEVDDCLFLPERPFMVVMSALFCTDPTVNATMLEVKYNNTEEGIDGTMVQVTNKADIPLPNLLVYIQGVKGNAEGMTHEPKMRTGVAPTGNSVRIVGTCRVVMSPDFNAEQYMDRLKECLKNAEHIEHPSPADYESSRGGQSFVLSRLMSSKADNGEFGLNFITKKHARGTKKIASEQVKQAGGPFYLNRAPNKDKYRQLKKADYFKLVGEPIDSFARLQGKLIHRLFGNYGIRALLRLSDQIAPKDQELQDRIFPMMICPNKQRCPVLACDEACDEGAGTHELFQLGREYRLSSITNLAGLRHSSMGRPTFKYVEGKPLMIILSHSYKNEYRKILAHLERATIFRKEIDQRKSQKTDGENEKRDMDEQQTIPHVNERDELVFDICGHGGMPIDSGAHVANPRTWTKDDPLVNIPWSQNANEKKNKSEKTYVADTGLPVAIFVNEHCFNETLKGVETPPMTLEEVVKFAGYGYAKGYTVYKMSDSELDLHVGNNGADFRKLSRFLLNRHFRIPIAMLFNEHDYIALEEQPFVSFEKGVDKKKPGWETIFVDAECPYFMEMGCSVRQQADSMITEKDIVYDFVEQEKFRHLEFPSKEVANKNGFHVQPLLAMGNGISNPDVTIVSAKSTCGNNTDTEHDDIGNEVVAPLGSPGVVEVALLGSPGVDETSRPEASSKGTSNGTESEINGEPVPMPEGTGIEDEEVMLPDYDEVDASMTATKVTIEDIIRNGFFNHFAGTLRFCGKSVYTNDEDMKRAVSSAYKSILPDASDKEISDFVNHLSVTYGDGETAIPLLHENQYFLNQGMIRNASPMSNRTFDCNVHFLLEEMELRGHARPDGGTIPLPENPQERVELLYDTLHAVCLFRVLGRTAPFHHYKNIANKESYIPRREDIPEFLLFMERTVEGNDFQSSLSQWISDQHKGQVPSEWHTYGGYSKFATQLHKELRPAFEQFYKTSFQKSNESWKDAVMMLKQVLQGMVANPKSKTHWLSQMIIGDMDELFDTPFGQCSSKFLVSAQGSRTCLVFLQNNGLFNKKKNNNLADALDAIQDFVNDSEKVPDDFLKIMGYTRKEVPGHPGTYQVLNVINGTKFGAMHAEHLMCKLYVQTKYTSAGYRKSLKPSASKVYCWPLLHFDKNLIENQRLTTHMEDCCATFLELVTINNEATKRLLTLPRVLVLMDETIKFPPTAATA